MKVSLLIVGDEAQVTLTPEGKTEEAVLNFLHQEPLAIRIKRAGEFALTQGGYFREFDHSPQVRSTMLVLTKATMTEKTEKAPSQADQLYNTVAQPPETTT